MPTTAKCQPAHVIPPALALWLDVKLTAKQSVLEDSVQDEVTSQTSTLKAATATIVTVLSLPLN